MHIFLAFTIHCAIVGGDVAKNTTLYLFCPNFERRELTTTQPQPTKETRK